MWQETLKPIRNLDAVDERARDLFAADLNGLRAALVSFEPPAAPGQARVELHLFNDLHVADILAEIAGGTEPRDIFAVHGGHRVRAGPGAGEVRCIHAEAGPVPEAVVLVLEPVGDYSTYTLELVFDPARIDPFFARLDFKFRPGCFTNDCDPPWEKGRPRPATPVIDYLAKDYDSFRHVLISAMMDRVPGWRATSEADFDQVLIGLFSAAADELSDYQDRVMNEAYFGSARSRVSLARHARLMDYHIHQGQQSSTWGRVTVAGGTAPFTLGEDLVAWAGGPDAEGDTVAFATRETRLPPDGRTVLAPGFNRFELHSWSGAQPALPAGATGADLALPAGSPITVAELRDAVDDGTLTRLLVAEELNPLTGRRAGYDRRARQVLRLEPPATLIHDPLEGRDVVRVRWREEDALRRDYAFTTLCPDGPVEGISAFYGNLVTLHHGLPAIAHFHEPGTPLPQDGPAEIHRHFARQVLYGETRAVLCPLPHELSPLAYLPIVPGGRVPPRSTLIVTVEEPGGATNEWDEVPSLVHSDDSAENGDHFVVETDERQESVLRFGNGVNGRLLPSGAVVHAIYQVGGGQAGNVGADAITGFAPLGGALAGAIEAVTNPFDVTDGRDPEPVAEILRNAPEAYRAHQLRAVTLADYIARAEEVPGVQRAVASYAWTGSWRTVRLVVDPVGTTELDDELVSTLAAHLEAVRLIGEDIELRPPRFVPLKIEVRLCLRPDAWPEDVRGELEQTFSDGWTWDGRPGFFNVDEWTFGEALHRSRIAARVHEVAGVEHVVSIGMKRFDAATPGLPEPEVLEMGFDEIVLVRNDPDHMERGSIAFDLRGGRQ
ncbi:putative baseplate assembly protein [Roseitranquillus sediminis]|uniref:putative baseplate assembly protein n=1 Tax=Roseitranquillus sediminis TaxID=2809051 RepID=UPI001D0C5B58|nr:putative baseplate assembly protein [Roseitranquillus sediminis]MBM9594976.1 putative baseplate assembly protein [Roseitranquillus sediminis]